jgi:hypothetical protein
LRPLCAPLLELVHQPTQLALALEALEAALATVPPQGVRGCCEYVLFPLLLLADNWAGTLLPRPDGTPPANPLFGARVAERVLACVEAVARVGGAGLPCGPKQLTALLQPLTAAMAVPRAMSSDEIRAHAVGALRAVFDATAAAAHPQVTTRPEEATQEQEPNAEKQRTDGTQTLDAEVAASSLQQLYTPDACAAVELLRAEATAPQLGHLISLLLHMVAEEGAAGMTGSRTLRAECLRTLTALLRLVDNAAALAFFLPGLVSGLAKPLVVAAAPDGGGMSGSAAGGSAVSEALNALCTALTIVLADAAHPHAIATTSSSIGQAAGILQQLQALALRSKESMGSTTTEGESAAAAASAGVGGDGVGSSQGAVGAPGRLRVELTADWLDSVVPKVHAVLVRTLPPLCAHPHATVRTAVGRCAGRLLRDCRRTLAPSGQVRPTASCATHLRRFPALDCQPQNPWTDGGVICAVCANQVLLECVLSLSMDDWPRVSEHARAHLQRMRVVVAGGGGAGERSSRAATDSQREEVTTVQVEWEALEAIILTLVKGLSRSLQQGERVALLHTRRLAAALRLAGPTVLQQHFLHQRPTRAILLSALLPHTPIPRFSVSIGSLVSDPQLPSQLIHATRRCLAAALRQCLVFMPGAAALVQTATADPAAASRLTGLPPALPQPSRSQADDAGSALEAKVAPSSADSERPSPQPPTETGLPDMPSQLSLIATRAVYDAVAEVCRTVGRLLSAHEEDGGGGAGAPVATVLTALVDDALQLLRDAAAPTTGAARGGGDLGWQRKAAAVVVILNETLYGATHVLAGPRLLPLAVSTVAEYTAPGLWDLRTTVVSPSEEELLADGTDAVGASGRCACGSCSLTLVQLPSGPCCGLVSLVVEIEFARAHAALVHSFSLNFHLVRAVALYPL